MKTILNNKYLLLFIIIILFNIVNGQVYLTLIAKNDLLRSDMTAPNNKIGNLKGSSTSQDYISSIKGYNFMVIAGDFYYDYKMANFASGDYKTSSNYAGAASLGNLMKTPFLCPSNSAYDYLNYIFLYNPGWGIARYSINSMTLKTEGAFGFTQFTSTYVDYVRPVCVPSPAGSIIFTPFASSIMYSISTQPYGNSLAYPSLGGTPTYALGDSQSIVLIDDLSNFFVFVLTDGVVSYNKTYTNNPTACPSGGRRAGIVDGANFYSTCNNNLQVFDIQSTSVNLLATYSNLWTTGYAINAGYDSTLGQLFFSVYNSASTSIVLTTVATNGKNQQTLDISEVAPIIDTNFYTIGVYNQNNYRKLYVPTPTGKIIDLNYTSLCPNECGGPTLGTCYQSTCTCTYTSFSLDCTKYIQTIPPIQSTGPIAITLVGNGFTSSASDYTGSSFLTVPLTNFTYVDATKVIFSISQTALLSQSPSLNSNYSLNLVYGGNNYVYTNMVTFAQPIVDGSSIEIGSTSFTIKGSNFYPTNYMTISLDGYTQTCQSQQTSIICPIGSSTKSGQLVVATLYTLSLYETYFFITPIPQTLQPAIFSTSSSKIILNAYHIGTIPSEYTVSVYQAGIQITNVNITSSSSLEFFSLDYITLGTIYISAVSVSRNFQSAPIAFTYSPPTITNYNQLTSPSKNYQITGTNFGKTAALVNFNDTQITLFSVGHTTIVFSLNSDALPPFTIGLTINGQSANSVLDITPEPKISSVGVAPLDGGTVQIIGEFLFSTSIVMKKLGKSDVTLICNPVGTTNYPANMTCTIPSGSGKYNVSSQTPLYKGTFKTSNLFSTSYSAPTITLITPSKYYQNINSNIMIQGTNYKNVNPVVLINNETCDIQTIDSLQIVCNITSHSTPVIANNPIPVKVIIDGLEVINSALLGYYYSCPDDCSGYGTCNVTTGICACNNMHFGDNCALFDCPNDCSDHGDCNNSNGICDCDAGWAYQDCSTAIPTIQTFESVAMLYQGNLTISGINFASSYVMQFVGNNTVYTPPTYQVKNGGTEITLPFNFSSNLDSPNVKIQFLKNGDVISEQFSYSFLLPQVSDLHQEFESSNVVLMVTIDNSYLVSKTKFYYGNVLQNYESRINGTSIIYSLKIAGQSISSYHSDFIKFIGYIDTSNIEIYNEFYTIQPMISSISPNTLSTSPMVATLTGYLFTSTNGIYPTLIQGSSTSLTSSNVTENQIIFISLNGINPSKEISVSINNTISNPIRFLSYQAPTIVNIEQENNVISIHGTNFGNDNQFIELNVGGIQVTLESTDHSLIIGQLPDNIISGKVYLLVLDQDIDYDGLTLLPNILSVEPKPFTDDTTVTIIGQYLRNTTIFYSTNDGPETVLNCSVVTQDNSNYPVSLGCDFLPGTGDFDLHVVSNVDENFDQKKSLDYQSPIINSIQPMNYKKNVNVYLTITGDSFTTNIELVSVSVQEENCEIISTDYNEIQCTLTSTQDQITNPIKVNVTIDGLSTIDNTFLKYEMLCPNNCSDMGSCNKLTGECTCNEGQTGNDCSTVDEVSFSPKQFNITLSLFSLSFLILIIF